MTGELRDVLVVGSGAAGVFAAHALRGAGVTLLDVGTPPDGEPEFEDDLYALRGRRPMVEELLGHAFESLQNIEGPELSPKLKAPFLRFVTRRPGAAPEVRSDAFRSVTSYSEGGLANAWGAQVYRFDDLDLRGFPLAAADLAPYYDRVTGVVGISGAEDDLAAFHGSAAGLEPPLELTRLGRRFLANYERRRDSFHRKGIRVGRPRLAVLSRDRDGRAGMDYANHEFFRPRIPAVYTPAYTLRELVRSGDLDYRPGRFVTRYEEHEGHVEVHSVAADGGGDPRVDRARYLVLALGALNTPRLVLASRGDTRTRLPVVENPVSFTPLIHLPSVGAPLETTGYSSQLNFCYEEGDERVIGMLYSMDGLLRSDILFNFPLPVRGALAAARHVLPATLLLQVFYAGEPLPANRLGVDEAGSLVIRYDDVPATPADGRLVAAFRRLGFLGVPGTTRVPEPGMSIHYGGSLPMTDGPEDPCRTTPEGRLGGSRRVYVADSSAFPRLPAKNLTFTIMAHASRVGSLVARRLEEQP